METNNQEKGPNILRKIQESIFWKYSKLITGSATFALILSIVFFVYETIESKRDNQEITCRLYEVQNSLSTRYLGIFPQYIKNTNAMLRKALEQKDDFSADTIVIFEDVLYYGIISDSKGFIEVNDKLLQLADKGAKVFLVYYKPQTALFVKNLREMLFSQDCYKQFIETQKKLKERVIKYQEEMRKIAIIRHQAKIVYDYRSLQDSLANVYFSDIIDKEVFAEQRKANVRTSNQKLPNDVIAEMILNERYFSATRDENHKAFEELINTYRKPIVGRDNNPSFKRQSWQETMDMCRKIDDVRSSLMEQPYDSICFEHFVKLFSSYTEIIENEYAYHRNITLIPIEDYLTMSCWMIGNRYEGYNVVIAFPNRYASSEIGFASQDDNIARYIHTMLQGIRTNYAPKTKN